MPEGRPDTLHVIGAGIAGLAAATLAARRGIRVEVHESTGMAGGRCRSWHASGLDRTIDNGTHLVVGACRALLEWSGALRAESPLVPARPCYPIVDLADGARFALRPNRGPLPWWPLVPSRRIPGTNIGDYTKAYLSLFKFNQRFTASQALDVDSTIGRRLWVPFLTSIMNMEPAAADWRSARAVLRRLALGGARAWQPWLAPEGLGAALVAPALAEIRRLGGRVHFRRRLVGMTFTGNRVASLAFAGGPEIDMRGAAVILALPPAAARALASLDLPRFGHRCIVCAHVRLRPGAPGLPAGLPFLGLVDGTAQWIAQRGDVISITASAADNLAERPAAEIAATLWSEARRALPSDPGAPGPWLLVKERRATITQTPAAMARRPGARTRYANLALAGDWTATGMPATLEGAVISAHRAVDCCLTSKKGCEI